MTKKCEFCETYKEAKKDNSQRDKELNSRPGRSFKVKSFLKVSMVDLKYLRYDDGEKVLQGRVTYRHRPLRYCPECGRRLIRERRKKNEQQADI